MDKEQLIYAANGWAERAKDDISELLWKFMEETGLESSDLAEMFDTDEDEILDILYGDCEISMLTLAKLIIATGSVLEIKPIEETPLDGQYECDPEDMTFDPGDLPVERILGEDDEEDEDYDSDDIDEEESNEPLVELVDDDEVDLENEIEELKEKIKKTFLRNPQLAVFFGRLIQ